MLSTRRRCCHPGSARARAKNQHQQKMAHLDEIVYSSRHKADRMREVVHAIAIFGLLVQNNEVRNLQERSSYEIFCVHNRGTLRRSIGEQEERQRDEKRNEKTKICCTPTYTAALRRQHLANWTIGAIAGNELRRRRHRVGGGRRRKVARR